MILNYPSHSAKNPTSIPQPPSWILRQIFFKKRREGFLRFWISEHLLTSHLPAKRDYEENGVGGKEEKNGERGEGMRGEKGEI